MKPTKFLPIGAVLLTLMALMVIGISMVAASTPSSAKFQASVTPGLTAPSPNPNLTLYPLTTPTSSSPISFEFCMISNPPAVKCFLPTSVATGTPGTPRPQSVRFGANNSYVYKNFVSMVACISAAFGSDPAVGVTKQCRYIPMPIQAFKGWTVCANEGGTCSFSGTKLGRYGTLGYYAYAPVTNNMYCSSTVFGNTLNFGYPRFCHYIDLAPSEGWSQCATQGGVCQVPVANQIAAYGSNGSFIYKPVNNSFYCTDAFFGSPASTDKLCYVFSLPEADPNGWVRCASDGQTCAFTGQRTVAYGANDSFSYIDAPGSVSCSSATFVDPIPGVAKYCYYSIKQAVVPAEGPITCNEQTTNVITIMKSYTIRGAGSYCMRASDLYYISSSNADLRINGINYSNKTVFTDSLPAKRNGYWYIGYSSNLRGGSFDLYPPLP